jgi:ferredoxin
MGEISAKVRIDHDLCVGNAMCRVTAPKAFAAGPNGLSVVADAAAESIELLREAAADCPVGAITLEEIPEAQE